VSRQLQAAPRAGPARLLEQLMSPDDPIIDTGFKPGELHIVYPVWVLFDASGISPLGKPDFNSLVAYSHNGGPTFVPLFTDWDLTFRFIRDYNPGSCGLPFGKASLEKLLTNLEQDPKMLVAFDPEPPHHVRPVTVADALIGVRWQNQ
jgi:hypothetical protein